jgi:hypothetical protein
MSNHFDIAVAWRIYPLVSKTPLVHPNDKFRLVKTSLLSFKNSMKGLKVSFFFILDGCPKEYATWIKEEFATEKISFIETDKIGNLKTFEKQIEVLSSQTDSDILYFAEDDYLYRPDLFHKLVEFIKNGEGDFATGYVHNDIFHHPIHDHSIKIKYRYDQFWMQINSTCLSFITSKRVLEQTKNVFLTYTKGNNDCSLWLVLTKTHILNPFSWWRFKGNRECIGILKVAVKRSFKYFFTGKKYSLWVSYPAICTHLEKGLESPGIDWQQLAIQTENTKDASK